MKITPIQKNASNDFGVIAARSSAGPETKTAPTRIIRMMMNNIINFFVLSPRY